MRAKILIGMVLNGDVHSIGKICDNDLDDKQMSRAEKR